MAIGTRYSEPNVYEADQNGIPLAGGQLWFFVSGTSTLQDTWSDLNLTVPNSNPVIADANGRFGSIFLSNTVAYKVSLFTAPTVLNPTGVQIWTEDPVGPASGGGQQATAGIIGEVRAFAGLLGMIPAAWYLCYGQAVSRSTYSAAFAVLGTIWGAGDGTTTFNLPDLRGRGLFGLDNMGGTPAARVTSGVSGISGVTLGATGGEEAMQGHLHTVNDPGHIHSITDAGHKHSLISNANGVAGADPQLVQTGPGGGPYTSTETTGITIDSATTAITMDTTGAGASQNMPPAAIVNWIVYLGV